MTKHPRVLYCLFDAATRECIACLSTTTRHARFPVQLLNADGSPQAGVVAVTIDTDDQADELRDASEVVKLLELESTRDRPRLKLSARPVKARLTDRSSGSGIGRE